MFAGGGEHGLYVCHPAGHVLVGRGTGLDWVSTSQHEVDWEAVLTTQEQAVRREPCTLVAAGPVGPHDPPDKKMPIIEFKVLCSLSMVPLVLGLYGDVLTLSICRRRQRSRNKAASKHGP